MEGIIRWEMEVEAGDYGGSVLDCSSLGSICESSCLLPQETVIGSGRTGALSLLL